MIFQEYLDGKGCTVIAKKLRRMNVKKLRGGKWNSERVADIIKNEKYMGNALLQKKYVKDHLTKKLIRNKGKVPQYYAEETHPAIIDSETFKRAQEIMKANRIKYKCEPGKKNYTFTSKIQCGICGKNYRHRGRGDKSTWVCAKHYKYGKDGCIAKPIHEELLRKLTNQVLEVKEFDEEKFKLNIEKITVQENRDIIFEFRDGRVIERGMV